jgi:hypothetical protein
MVSFTPIDDPFAAPKAKPAGGWSQASIEQTLGEPVRVTSTGRSPAHNRAVGGSPTSSHLSGEAIDFVPQDGDMRGAVGKLEKAGIPYDQILQEGDHVHVGWGPKMRGQVEDYGAGRGAPPAAPGFKLTPIADPFADARPSQGPADRGTGRLPTKLDPTVANLRAPKDRKERLLSDARQPQIKGGVRAPIQAEPERRFLSEASLGAWDAGEAATFAARHFRDGPLDAYAAARQAQEEERQHNAGPGATIGGVAGGLTGMGAGAAGAVEKGLGYGERALRAARGGLAAGTVAGASSAKKPGDISKGAAVGGAAGAALGPVVESVADAIRWGARSVDTLSNNKFGSAVKAAEAKLYTALKKDGVIGPKADKLIAQWRRNGVEPSLMDIGGKHTQQLIRRAGGVPGRAQHVLRQNAEKIEENVGAEATQQVHKLVNDGRPADEIVKDLTARRKAVADKRYPTQYKTPVDVAKILPEISDPEVRRYLRAARQDAVLGKKYDQARDIDNLLSLSGMDAKTLAAHLKQHPQMVQAGTIDTIQSALQEAAGKLRSPGPGVPGRNRAATGLGDRAKALGAVLDAVPELKDARRTYRIYSDMIRGFEFGADALKTKDAGVTAKAFAAMNKGAQQTARLGFRQAVENELAGRSTATLRNLQSNKATRKILATMFGDEEANRISRAAKYRLEQLENAHRAAGGAPQAEHGNVGPFVAKPTSAAKHAVIAGVDRASRGLSEKEARGVANLGKAPASQGLRRAKPLDDRRVRRASRAAQVGLTEAGRNAAE